jgi:hypothetical protein
MKTEENKKQEVKELSKEELNTVFGGNSTEDSTDIGIDEDGVNTNGGGSADVNGGNLR